MTILKYSCLFSVSEGGTVEIIPDNFPMGAIAPEGYCPRGVMALWGIVALMGSNWRDSHPLW